MVFRFIVPITKQCKHIGFPINIVKKILLIILIVQIILFLAIFSLSLTNTNLFLYIDFFWFLEVFFITTILMLIMILIHYKIFRFFKTFNNDFGQRIAKGFFFIMISLMITTIFYFIHNASHSEINRYLIQIGEIELVFIFARIIEFIDIFFSLIGLYGIYLIATSLSLYKIKSTKFEQNLLNERTRYNLNLKNPYIPMDLIKIIIIVIGFISPIYFVYYYTIKPNGYVLFNFDIYIFLNFHLFVFLLTISSLVMITENLFRYKISKLFSIFKGKFEYRFSLGFKIILIFMVIGWINSFFSFTTFSILMNFINLPTYVIYSTSFSMIYRTFYVFITMGKIYGLLVIVSSLAYYDPFNTTEQDNKKSKNFDYKRYKQWNKYQNVIRKQN